MRKIKVPISYTMSHTFDMHNLEGEILDLPDGRKLLKTGTFDIAVAQPEFDLVRENGAQILYGVLGMEQRMENILTNYLFGPLMGTSKPERDFFSNYILKTDKITFSFKRNLLDKLIDKHDFLIGEEKSRMQRGLNSIMGWRNAFAHGHLIRDNKSGFILQFYSGGQKELNLDDNFWQEVEKTFGETDALFRKLEERFNPYLLSKHRQGS